MTTPAETYTAPELAKAYAETILGQANAWGQYVHPSLGRSDYIMGRLREMVGDAECDRLIDEALTVAEAT